MSDIKEHDIIYIKDGLLKDVVVSVMIPVKRNNDGKMVGIHFLKNEIYYLETHHSIDVHYLREELLTVEEYRALKIKGLLNG